MQFNFPIYTTNGTHYVKHISPFKCLEVLPTQRVELIDYENLKTGYFEELIRKTYEENETKIIEEVEFNLYFENTIKHLNQLN
jgi:hypothetical protein